MKEFDVRDAIERLAETASSSYGVYAEETLKRQFNLLLDSVQKNNFSRLDLMGLSKIPEGSVTGNVLNHEFKKLVIHLSNATEFMQGESSEALGKFDILRAEKQLEIDYLNFSGGGQPVGLVFFDIDGFKRLNGKYTETIVDEYVLKPFMRFVFGLVESRGYGYSVGGDEFIILLNNCDDFETEAFGNRLLRSAAKLNFELNGVIENITLSIGTCCSELRELSINELRQLANKAENEAKSLGKNRVVRLDRSLALLANAAGDDPRPALDDVP